MDLVPECNTFGRVCHEKPPTSKKVRRNIYLIVETVEFAGCT
jgi:hypothetical protein